MFAKHVRQALRFVRESVRKSVAALVREDGYLLGGLMTLPFGLWVTLGAASEFVWPFYARWQPVSGLLLLPATVIAYVLLYRFYKMGGHVPRSVFAHFGVPVVVVLGILVIGFWEGYRPNFSATGAFTGLVFLTFGYRFFVHRVAGILLLVVSLLIPNIVSMDINSIVTLLIGFFWVIGSLHEHITLLNRTG